MSISNENIHQLLIKELPEAKIEVDGDGYKYSVSIVDDQFEGLSTLKRHQRVYKILDQVIVSGELHALTIKAYTISESP
ncbi:MAG: BolA/IbaG family iron-sulfur metabolism protein [Thiotrichaceae bacterium]|nr:BolA/IbaG family iron-sulfur metabolism protein [Thiotrichaceae bacterium]